MQQEHQKTDDTRPQLAGRSLDIKVALAALAVFGIFMYFLIRALFPTGVALNEESLGQTRDVRNAGAGRELSYSHDGIGNGVAVAEVLAVRRDVKVKGRNELAWRPAQQGITLGEQDSLQTQRNSGATIRLDDESVVKIGANSLIVFQGGVTDLFTPRHTNSIVMMEGSLDAQFASTQNNPRHLEVALPNGLARFIPGDDAAAVAFNINVNPDLSSSVSVMAGKSVVTVAGQTRTIDAEHGITISINGEVLERGRLPARPGNIRPRNRTVYEYRALPPEVVFAWDAVPDVDAYRLKVARDPEMSDLVIDQGLGKQRFGYNGLQDGTYYWQVSGMNGFMEGPAAGPHVLELVRDEQPPRLSLQPVEHQPGQQSVTLRGRTDAARVYIQGEEVATRAGRFQHEVPIDLGTNLIVVEAVDNAGNVAYESQIFNSTTFMNGGGK